MASTPLFSRIFLDSAGMAATSCEPKSVCFGQTLRPLIEVWRDFLFLLQKFCVCVLVLNVEECYDAGSARQCANKNRHEAGRCLR